ncbi:S8 family peptidase [Halobacterium jilantaiense]|uniref:Subtilase family protein n=1 Tax=Halobacterium jilantaiense TaxID=355548 RepID=A0A1I0MXZ4_9EURY|nr:S8 family serine peptidase [Halobacterium jilantaiense]SEV93497.1 Subtilase family protein [Halobacterium jilantaiense]
MAGYHRRTFLKGTGVALSGLAVGAGGASATSADERFLINLRKVDRGDVPEDVEVIHDLSAADVLVARGDQSRVGSATATAPDVKIDRSDDEAGAVVDAAGPTAAGDSASHNHDGPASNTEYQWDKREQDLSGELTDKPGGGNFVHDTATGEGTRVAVVDSGVYDDHPDLAGVVNADLSKNITGDGFDFRPNGAGSHGTHVAGTIAATNDNDGPGGGVLGTAPDTEIVAVRMFSGLQGYAGDGLAGWQYAAQVGCDAINYSVGYTVADTVEYPSLIALEQIISQVAAYVRSQGTVIVNSAGNASLDMDAENTLSLPTEADGVFGVSATGPIGYGWGGKHSDNEAKWLTGNRLDEPTTDPAPYTNYGSAVDVSAGGGNYDVDAISAGNADAYNDLVYSTVNETTPDGEVVAGYGWKAGTSMAAPQVTGAVALVRSLRPDASVEAVESLVRETASLPDEGETYHGAGHLDLEALVEAASDGGNGEKKGKKKKRK